MATGQPAPSAVFDRHSQTCAECSERSQALNEAARVARASLGERASLQPPATVWRAISQVAEEGARHPELVVELPVAAPAVLGESAPAVKRWPWLVAALVLVVLILLAVLGFALAS